MIQFNIIQHAISGANCLTKPRKNKYLTTSLEKLSQCVVKPWSMIMCYVKHFYNNLADDILFRQKKNKETIEFRRNFSIVLRRSFCAIKHADRDDSSFQRRYDSHLNPKQLLRNLGDTCTMIKVLGSLVLTTRLPSDLRIP